MKILKREEIGNGYGCSCCGHSWKNTEWIKLEKMLDGKNLLKYMETEHNNMTNDHCVALQYERDGKILYGFNSRIYKISKYKPPNQ